MGPVSGAVAIGGDGDGGRTEAVPGLSERVSRGGQSRIVNLYDSGESSSRGEHCSWGGTGRGAREEGYVWYHQGDIRGKDKRQRASATATTTTTFHRASHTPVFTRSLPRCDCEQGMACHLPPPYRLPTYHCPLSTVHLLTTTTTRNCLHTTREERGKVKKSKPKHVRLRMPPSKTSTPSSPDGSCLTVSTRSDRRSLLDRDSRPSRRTCSSRRITTRNLAPTNPARGQPLAT